ncbi:hypothetical protein G4Y79_09905 [Phototrophicus methaneseepsis]|uniref:Uncharacterized protein n=1 Tax=Phototrophicus methaneseepsis TaxID=2710758 RepID=A0A7S8EDD1_9CHLR|nr:hypothetical protein [Phototrophicus methaneseepsis]QPC84668.1 hypothetical protein G4Y79_09905 [Phototrophicus methaneseepsis]
MSHEAHTPPQYKMRPPVLHVQVEDSMDIMIVRDTTRRAASLLGFSPAHRAQLATAAATLAELVLKTGEPHTINLNGVLDGIKDGLQISTETPWLQGVSANNVLVALKSKMGDLVDEIVLVQAPAPTIVMIMWIVD